MALCRSSPAGSNGFTLIELLVTMSVSAVVVAFMALFITTPVDAYLAQTRRTELHKSEASAWESVSRDVRTALPNSVRTLRNGSVVALEMLTVLDWARYRDGTVMVTPAIQLDLTAPDGAFRTTSHFLNVVLPASLVVEPLNADPYQTPNVMTPPGTVVGIGGSPTPGEDQVSIAPAFRFTPGSPTHHVFLVSGPVNYLCDETAGTLRRYVGYSIASNLATRASDAQLTGAGATSALVAQNVTACSVGVSAGTAQHNQLVTLQVTFTQGGESILLAQQARVVYQP